MIWIYTLISTAWSLELAPVDRPSVGTSAFTIERGGLQLESGLQIDGSQAGSLYSFPTMLRIGLHDRIELRPYTSIVSHSEANTLLLPSSGIQGKVELYAPEDKYVAIGILASSDMNSVSGLFLIDAWKDDWSIWLNTGYSLEYETTTGSTAVVGGVAYALPNKQGLFIESSATLSSTTAVAIQSGYSKTLDSVQVDIYALKDVTTPGAWQLATGIGWRFR